MCDLAKVIVVLAALTASSCASSEAPSSLMGNTNWLTSCDEDDDCGDDLSCSCGVCTRECATASDCSGLGGATCDADSQAFAGACGSSIAMSVCLPECSSSNPCGAGQECVEAHCLPREVVSSEPEDDAGGGGLGCGPRGAFVSNNVTPDQECTYSPDSRQWPTGQYDVAAGFNGREGSCGQRQYVLALLVYSCLRGVNDTLQIHTATVALRDNTDALIAFDRFADDGEAALANPFEVISNTTLFPMRDDEPTSGVAFVEIIPTEYTEQLDDFDGKQVVAEVRLHGTTVGGADVDLDPFFYPIEICDGCLMVCIGLIPPEATLEEIYGEGSCKDNAGADGRICLDTDCPSP